MEFSNMAFFKEIVGVVNSWNMYDQADMYAKKHYDDMSPDEIQNKFNALYALEENP